MLMLHHGAVSSSVLFEAFTLERSTVGLICVFIFILVLGLISGYVILRERIQFLEGKTIFLEKQLSKRQEDLRLARNLISSLTDQTTDDNN